MFKYADKEQLLILYIQCNSNIQRKAFIKETVELSPVYTIQPVVKPVVQPVVSRKRGFSNVAGILVHLHTAFCTGSSFSVPAVNFNHE